MRKRRYNLIQRIFIKANAVLYTLTGRVVDRLGWQEQFPFEVKGHFGDVIEVSHEYPVNYKPEHQALFDEWKRYQTFPHDLFFVKDVVLTSDGIVLQRHRTFIKTLPHPVFRFKYGVLYNLKTRLFYREFKTDPAKNYLLLFDNWSWNNYFHWIIDALCRAQLVEMHARSNYTILLPLASPKYLTETLKLYGYSDFVYLPERSKTKLPALSSMNYAAWSGQQHPEILKVMVRQVKAALHIKPSEAKRRIYVSRGKQFSRRVENEAELIRQLEKHGFETVYFEGMSFEEQVKTLHEAAVLVTSHGANMTNLAWMQEGGKILELLNNRKPNFCYWSVASCLGHDYYYQLCGISTADHVVVDIEEVEKNLKAIL
jgi:hypothetical protein